MFWGPRKGLSERLVDSKFGCDSDGVARQLPGKVSQPERSNTQCPNIIQPMSPVKHGGGYEIKEFPAALREKMVVLREVE